LKYIWYFYRPQLVEDLWKWELEEGDDEAKVRTPVTSVYASSHYCYAVVQSKNEVYSWGMGENYVLGNRDENSEYRPYKLDPRMFEENKVVMMACGTQHCVSLTLASADSKLPDLDLTKWDGKPYIVEEPESPKKTPTKSI